MNRILNQSNLQNSFILVTIDSITVLIFKVPIVRKILNRVLSYVCRSWKDEDHQPHARMKHFPPILDVMVILIGLIQKTLEIVISSLK